MPEVHIGLFSGALFRTSRRWPRQPVPSGAWPTLPQSLVEVASRKGVGLPPPCLWGVSGRAPPGTSWASSRRTRDLGSR